MKVMIIIIIITIIIICHLLNLVLILDKKFKKIFSFIFVGYIQNCTHHQLLQLTPFFKISTSSYGLIVFCFFLVWTVKAQDFLNFPFMFFLFTAKTFWFHFLLSLLHFKIFTFWQIKVSNFLSSRLINTR